MTVQTEMVTFPCEDHATPGYLAQPKEAGSGYPAVVVIQEWWGLVPHIKEVARAIAVSAS